MWFATAGSLFSFGGEGGERSRMLFCFRVDWGVVFVSLWDRMDVSSSFGVE